MTLHRRLAGSLIGLAPAGAGLFLASAAGAAESRMPQLNPEFFAPQLIWLAITFGLFYVVMRAFALPAIQTVLETREARIDGDLTKAAGLREEAQTALKAYESSLAKARQAAQATLATRQAALAAEAEAHGKSLKAALDAQLADANRAIAAKRDAVMANLRSLSAEATSAVVERLLDAKPDAGAVLAAVDHELGRLR